ncbi:MAG: hypothetical protein ACYDA6_01545 [Solirubrobacteraceae bacterium]
MGRLAALIVWLVALVGLAGAAVALQGWGGKEVFRVEQSGSLRLRPALTLGAPSVQAVARLAPEPVTAARRTAPVQTTCQPRGAGVLRNLWDCTIRYRSGTVARYRIVVAPNGSYSGSGSGEINGCCLKVPTLQ